MVGELQSAKRPVSAALAGPYGHPFHPILVTVPIGAWVASFVFDVASYVVTAPADLARGALWLIGIGLIGAVAAAMVGLLDLFAIPTGTQAFRTGLTHMTLNTAVTLAFAVDLWWRMTVGAHPGSGGLGPQILSAVSLVALAVAGYLGGRLAYRYGVRVADEATQAAGFQR